MNLSGENGLQDSNIEWQPDPDVVDSSRVMAFIRQHNLQTYDELLNRSIGDPDWFWSAVVEELGITWQTPYTSVLDTSAGIEWPVWFDGGRMNYVTSAVDRHLTTRAGSTAIRWEGDDGETRTLTFAELSVAINQACNMLQSLGVRAGDRVGIFLPMIPETAISMLACGKMGAIFVPIFSGFGVDAVANRLSDAGATCLITADGFLRRGKAINMVDVATRAAERVSSLQHIVAIPRLGWASSDRPADVHDWNELVAAASPEFDAADTSASDPYMLIYTSGTTGKPKGTLHVHAGFPVKAAMDMALCFDLKQDDVLFWLTDLGWMMGPWAIAGGLIAGGSVLLYEGTPDFPEPDRLWQLVERHEVSVLGVSPTAIRALMAQGDDWLTPYPMPTLKAIGSTGEPWNPEPWRWTMQKVGRNRCPIVNYSGGTEIGGGIIVASTIHPQKPCSFSGPVPGTAADVVNALGQPVRGEVGELVIRAPWVGMTQGFWQDNERYIESYWSTIPGMWVHGDWALIDDEGFWYILGRSDDTLNVAGKRVGPAEIESAAVAHPDVREAAAIGVPHPVKGETIVVFAIPRNATSVDSTIEVEAGILATVAEHMGRPLRPDRAFLVNDLPKTRNAKIMRRVIRAAYLGHDPGDLTALENPHAVDDIAKLGNAARQQSDHSAG